MNEIKVINLIIVTDCGGTDEGRYNIAVRRCFWPHRVEISFFATESMNTLHTGFIAAAHAISTVDLFGPLRKGELVGLLVNAAPRHGSENGHTLRGTKRKLEGEELDIHLLKNGVWVVGPNAGTNFFFLKELIAESFVLKNTSGSYTPFRSMEVMIPVFAKIFGVQENPHLQFVPQKVTVANAPKGVFVADWDSHGNIYLVSTLPDDKWIPPIGQSRVFRVGHKIARLHHVDGIFAGNTGDQTLTVGSLQLNGKPVYYIVLVGGNAHSSLGNPPVGTKVEIEE